MFEIMFEKMPREKLEYSANLELRMNLYRITKMKRKFYPT